MCGAMKASRVVSRRSIEMTRRREVFEAVKNERRGTRWSA
jgi:hypothetical protein